MAAIILPRPWTQQPQQPVPPDWGNPITRGMELLWLGSDPANLNLARTGFATRSGTGIATAVHPQGVARTFNGSASTLSWQTGETSLNHDFTIFMILRSHVAGGSAQRMFHVGSAATIACGVFNVSEQAKLRYTKLGVAAMEASNVTCPQYEPCVIALTYNATTGDLEFSRRNLLTGSVVAQTVNNAAAHAGNLGEIGLSHAGGEGGDCGIFTAAFWWRALAKREIESLVVKNPWQLFSTAKRRWVFPTVVRIYPTSDITTAGWTPTPGGTYYTCVDEVAADDADYITSPFIGAATAPITMGINGAPIAIGTYTINVRARTQNGTATLRVYLLDSSGAQVGVTANQTINTTPTTYALSITTTGTASRVRIEVVT